MNIRVLDGAFTEVKGSSEELDTLEDRLLEWSRQYDPRGRGCSVFSRRAPSTLLVLTGAMADMNKWASHPLEYPEGISWPRSLRDYQREAVVAALAAPRGRGIIEAPGGSGKTYMAAGLIAAAAALEGVARWVYLVQNKELAAQTQRTFSKVIPEMVEAFGGGDCEVVCGSYGTVDPRAVREADGLIVDEVHGAAAPTRARVIVLARRASYRIGMSATPLLRQDPKNAVVVGLFGPAVYCVKPERLIRAGHLSKGKYHVVCL